MQGRLKSKVPFIISLYDKSLIYFKLAPVFGGIDC